MQAGFGQIEHQVMKVGMAAEAACISKPWTIIPMPVIGVQDCAAEGQFRGGEQIEDVTAGSACLVNAYPSNHNLISSGKLRTAKTFRLLRLLQFGSFTPCCCESRLGCYRSRRWC